MGKTWFKRLARGIPKAFPNKNIMKENEGK
jgi:hypothetical protein